MMQRGLGAILILLATFGATPLMAVSPNDVTPLRAAPAALNPAKAYILYRSSLARSGLSSIEHVFVRIPSSEESAAWETARRTAYEAALPRLRRNARNGPVPTIDQFSFEYAGPPNTYVIPRRQYLVGGAQLRTMLLEVPAGEYVIYGAALDRWLVTCNCLGTVRFEARPGVITNIGTLYADKVHNDSPLPYLEDNVGPSMFRSGLIFGQALVPATMDDILPPELRNLPVQLAEFHAVGPFRDPTAVSINRLAPIPGILAYDRGRVIDVRAATATAQ